MQVFKKIGLFLFMVLLASCRSGSFSRGGADGGGYDVSEDNNAIVSYGTYRVGVLLPLSGSASKYGQGLKNATLMALDDLNNSDLVLQFYDTKSTPEGARVAVENAIGQGSQLLIGPLMSAEVQAISGRATDMDIPVISFSTKEEVLQRGVYTIGLLVDEQVDRIVSYAASKGRHNFALLLPDNDTGIAVGRATVRSAQKYGVNVVKIAFYAPNTSDFSAIVKDMTGLGSRLGKADKKFGNVDFDAVLIPETGPRLKSIVSMFGYYDVLSPKVKFLGTTIWENTNLNNELAARGGWYPSLSRTYSAYFAAKYNTLFGEKPSSLYFLAYDAVAMANALAKKPANIRNHEIHNPTGYAGINGVFRFFADGRNEHSLDVLEVTKTVDVVVDSAPKTFERVSSTYDLPEVSTITYPQFFGKDFETAKSLIYTPKIIQPANDNLIMPISNFFLER